VAKFIEIDASVIVSTVKATIANGKSQDAIKYLNLLIPANGAVINSVDLDEIRKLPEVNSPYYTQRVVEHNLINQWLDQAISDGRLRVRELPNYKKAKILFDNTESNSNYMMLICIYYFFSISVVILLYNFSDKIPLYFDNIKYYFPYFYYRNSISINDKTIVAYYILTISLIIFYYLYLSNIFKITFSFIPFFIFALVILYWLLGLDGRTIKLSAMQNGDMSAAVSYSLILPSVHLLLIWISGVFGHKKT